MRDWLEVRRGAAPLILAFPHVGADLADVEHTFRSPWLAGRDTDWGVDSLYEFAHALGATSIRTNISRSVIDVNRDPSGASLYPGQATTELCPTTTFDGELLYKEEAPDALEIERRRRNWFHPYHDALAQEIARLRAHHPHVVLYDAHAIRSRIPRLFDGELPHFNIGTNGGASCDGALERAVMQACTKSGLPHVLNGRFKGGWTTRHYGRPEHGVHAIQMELAMRGYLAEPDKPTPGNWPPAMTPGSAIAPTLHQVIAACFDFALTKADT